MAVENETIIQKMKTELNQAQQKGADKEAMKKHIASIQLLCDLLLDEKLAAPPVDNEITEEEMKAMIGKSETKQSHKKTTIKDDEDANGDSIFDF